MDNNRYHECNLILALLFIIDVVLLMLQQLLVMLMALWLHRREEQNFLDIAAVGDEHCKAIDTKAPSAGWRHAMLKCFAERFVDHLRLIVALAFLRSLLLKLVSLRERVVHLSECIRKLLTVDVQLKALCEPWFGAVVLRKR